MGALLLRLSDNARWYAQSERSAIARAPFALEICLNLSGRGVAKDGFRLLHESGEACGVIYGDVGQHLAVELDSGGLETVDELRVADVVDLGGGIDAHDPERAELAFFLLASAVSELQSALYGFLRCLVELRFCEEITAGALENLFAAVVAFCSTFYAGHCLVLLLVLRYAAGGRMRRPMACTVTSSLACFLIARAVFVQTGGPSALALCADQA